MAQQARNLLMDLDDQAEEGLKFLIRDRGTYQGVYQATDQRKLPHGQQSMQIFEGTNQIQRLVISRDLAKG